MAERFAGERAACYSTLLHLSAVVTISGCCPPQLSPAEPARAVRPEPHGSLVAIGDTQRTYWGERLVFRAQNEDERQALMSRMAREERPAFLVHLGDMVSYGSSSCQWSYFDQLFSPFTQRQIRTYPVMGNHDYWGSDETALAHVRARFPELAVRTYYTLRYDGLALVFLDSNLAGDAERAQTDWLGAELDRFESDPTLSGVALFSHHPPFTLGRHRTDDRLSDPRVGELVFGHEKAVLFLSGHVHGYERFSKRGRTFVVSGGGGGPRVEYLPASAAHDEDPELTVEFGQHASPEGDGFRPFNYVVLTVSSDNVHGVVKCLAGPRCNERGELDVFDVKLPSGERAKSP